MKKAKRSISEKILERLLRKEYPDLTITANNRLICDYEIDIAIPNLRIAIEWNGILHRKPIFGLKQLAQVQKRDRKKRNNLMDDGWCFIIVEDIDSKKPILYAQKVFNFIKDSIKNDKIKPKKIFKLKLESTN